MENLNAEQVKKALECCGGERKLCRDCPYACGSRYCVVVLREDALALITSQEQKIKELTEENERLRAENEIKSQKRANIFEISNAFERGRTDGVRKMQERLKAQRFSDASPHDYDLLHCVIDGIAKKMLEGEK